MKLVSSLTKNMYAGVTYRVLFNVLYGFHKEPIIVSTFFRIFNLVFKFTFYLLKLCSVPGR